MATPNMNLTEIVPGVTPGPTYASNIVSNFSTIDSHDHTTGKGVRVPSSGLNINSDLPFNGNGSTGLGKSQFNSLSAALSSAADYRSVHVVNGELFYLDGSGNSVQITSSGSVSGSTGNITGLSSPASVTFSTNKYIFKDTATSFAIIESSDIRLFEDAAGAITNYVALKSPASLAATYTLTMPAALPAGDRYVQSDNSGNLSFVDADSIGSSMTTTGANAIASEIDSTGSNAISEVRTRSTGTSVSAGGVAISADSGANSITGLTYADVTNLSVTITTSGRPVCLALISSGVETGNGFSIDALSGASSDSMLKLKYVRDLTDIAFVRVSAAESGGSSSVEAGGANFMHIDTPSAGTYTYKLQARVLNSGDSGNVNYAKLIAYEL